MPSTNYSWGYLFLARALSAGGMSDEAVPNVQKAIRFDPALGDLFAGELGFVI
jgi:hypothetical protein